MAIKKCPSHGSPFSKHLIGYLFISIVGLQLSSAGNLIDEDDNQTNQISSIESIALVDNATLINSTTMVSHNQNSSSQSTESSASPKPSSSSTPTESPSTSTTTTTTSTTTLPPPLPTPLPSKGHPKLYSDSPQSLYMVMDNLLKSKAPYLGRTKRMKRSRPNMIRSDSSSGNPFSLIKYLLANHITSPSDYPASNSLANPKPGQFGSIYSSNLEDSLNRNDFSSGSMMMNRINSRFNPEQSVSFYPLTTSDIEALELTGEGDDSFDSGFGGGDDGWSNQGTIDLINQLETDGSNGNNNPNNNVDIYSMDPFIPLRSFRSIPTRSQSELLMRPIIAMKRKRRQNGSYLFNNNDKSPNSIILGSSLFGGDNRYRSRLNANQYEQLINRINDNPNA
ncbi:uncharacterized protein DDB_G0271670-like [Panonychus citri]|uniref:uncharacterized protein DDB_G0271670-like n=1 Tax=Panonychus citri TaxID=50023 RepID=UPI0023073FD8|nr:uncharacterized protein DDB_G0271670-like [Panonychus citri]